MVAYTQNNELPNQVNNTFHHNSMAKFVDTILLNEEFWDQSHGNGGNLGWQYYHDMAWGDLIKYKNPTTGQILFYQEYLNHNPNQNDRD